MALGDPKDFEEDMKIRWSLINLVKTNKIEEADKLIEESYIGRADKLTELKHFYKAIK